jgi:hypothetical protein
MAMPSAFTTLLTATVIRQAMSRLQKCLPERASDTAYRSLNSIVTLSAKGAFEI